MKLPIGILHGRLSPSLDGRFQFSPKDWAPEFKIAREMGLESIEWIFDWVDYAENPILFKKERLAIARISDQSGVGINSICADHYMKYRFIGEEAMASVAMLDQLIEAAAITKQKLILIPFLEANAIKTDLEKKEVIANISKSLPYAKKQGVRIGFETEMPAEELADFLSSFNSDQVGVYYDIGNCTSYGFDCPKDIRFLGKRVFGVHAKDRKAHTTQSLTLGTGDADYDGCFTALKEIGFSGTIIMQAWRGQDYLKDAREQLLFLKSKS